MEQWLAQHGTVSAAYAQAMRVLDQRKTSALQQLLKAEDVTRNQAFAVVMTGGELELYLSVVKSIAGKLSAKMDALDGPTAQILSPYLSALNQHCALSQQAIERPEQNASSPNSLRRNSSPAWLTSSACADATATHEASSGGGATTFDPMEGVGDDRTVSPPQARYSSEDPLARSIGDRIEDPLARSFGRKFGGMTGLAAVSPGSSQRSDDDASASAGEDRVSAGVSSRLRLRALADLEARIELEEKMRRIADAAEFPCRSPPEPDRGKSPSEHSMRSDNDMGVRYERVDPLGQSESAIALPRVRKRVSWMLPHDEQAKQLLSRSLPRSHEKLLSRDPNRKAKASEGRWRARVEVDDEYLRRELGAAHVGEPPGMVYQNELPSGSNASVSVWRKADDELVVVKRFSLARVQKSGVELLLNEVRLYHALEHRHIVRCNGAFVSRGDLCIMLDYACGGTVEQVVERQHGRPFEDCFISEWLSQLASAILFMHSKGLLHRDISAANVFLDFEGNVVVGDLGLSKRVAICSDGADSDGGKDSLATTRCGTPDFLSPELVNGKAYGRPSDAWAVGVILFCLLTLRKPFVSSASSMFQVIEQISLGEVLPEAQEALAKCGQPKELCSLASKAGLLNPDPARRMQLEEVLQRFPLPEPWEG